MPTVEQANFHSDAKKRLIDLRLSIKALAEIFGVHRNSVSMAIRHPGALPDLHRRIAKRLNLPTAL